MSTSIDFDLKKNSRIRAYLGESGFGASTISGVLGRRKDSAYHYSDIGEVLRQSDGLPGILQSAQEAIMVRGLLDGKDNSAEAQLTRTTATYFIKNGKVHIAFDDDPEESLFFKFGRRSREKAIEVSLEDSVIKDMLLRSYEEDRVVNTQRKKLPSVDKYETITLPNLVDSKKFGNHPIIKGIYGKLGSVVAEDFRQRYEKRYGAMEGTLELSLPLNGNSRDHPLAVKLRDGMAAVYSVITEGGTVTEGGCGIDHHKTIILDAIPGQEHGHFAVARNIQNPPKYNDLRI